MNFFHYISSDNYIIANIKSYPKINIIYPLVIIYFIISPYTSLKISQFFIALIEITFIITFKSLYFNHSLSIIKNSLSLYLYASLLNQFINEKYYISDNIKLSNILLVYYFQVTPKLYINKINLYISYYYISYQLVAYVQKIMTLNLLYLLSAHKISFLIRNEVISIKISNMYEQFRKLRQYDNQEYKKNQINMLLINHMLEKIIESFNKIYIGLKIKNINSKYIILKHLFLYIEKFTFYLLKYRNNLNVILYIKSIKALITHKKYI